jgi:hypothetical protein
MDRTNAERQRRYIAKLKAAAKQPPSAKPERDDVDWRRMYYEAGREIDRLKQLAGKHTAAAPLVTDDALRQQIVDLKSELQLWHSVLKDRHGGLSKPMFDLIVNCLDPKKTANADDVAKAFRMFEGLQWCGLPQRIVALIRRSLHPDTRKLVSDKERLTARNNFDAHRLRLMNNTQMPVQVYHLTAEEWAWMRRTKGKRQTAKTHKAGKRIPDR